MSGIAHAATGTSVSLSGSELRVVSAPGAGLQHDLEVTATASSVTVKDLLADVVAKPPCVAVGARQAQCPAGSVASLAVTTADGHDFVQNRTSVPSIIRTGAGDDTVIDGSGNDVIDLGPGDDGMFQGDGSDIVNGGPGHLARTARRGAWKNVCRARLVGCVAGWPGERVAVPEQQVVDLVVAEATPRRGGEPEDDPGHTGMMISAPSTDLSIRYAES